MQILLTLIFLALLSYSKGFGVCPIGTKCARHRIESSLHLSIQQEEEQPKKDENQQCISDAVQVHERTFILKPDNATNAMYQRRRFLPFRKRVSYPIQDQIAFHYKYNELVIPPASSPALDARNTKNRIILLIMPIGVGIGRWYYDRLLEQFQSPEFQETGCQNTFLVPDLLGGGSASLISSDGSGTTTTTALKTLPLLNVQDWSEQLIDLMSNYEEHLEGDASRVEWCLVSNGGCVPIALEIAKRFAEYPNLVQGKLTNLILSATPRIGSLLKPQDTEKVQKSFRTLSGMAGNLFWWYALRKEGKFIQKFSEKNLASKAENLGSEWRPKCVETAKEFNGLSRFSTFAFLAGSLNGGNQERFDALKGVDWLKIDVITGGDKRSNPAKSWFWDRSKEKKNAGKDEAEEYNTIRDETIDETPEITSLVPFLKENGNSGREVVVKGRRCPAHEDAKGFAMAVTTLLQS